MAKNKSMQDRLIVALGLALEEIHHPGSSRANGLDVIAMCEGVIKEASKMDGIPQLIREELKARDIQHEGLTP